MQTERPTRCPECLARSCSYLVDEELASSGMVSEDSIEHVRSRVRFIVERLNFNEPVRCLVHQTRQDEILKDWTGGQP